MQPPDDPSEARSPIQVIGLCRFSVPSRGAFRVIHDSVAQRREMLYAPARLNYRLVWLEHVLLPAIRAQSDPEFILVLLLGEDFPQPWLGRIEALTRDIPQIRLAFALPLEHRAICADAMRPHIDPEAVYVAQFRLDDDDAIATTFVRRVRRDVAWQDRMLSRNGLMALDYGKGLVLRDTGAELWVEPCITQCWAPGLAIVTRPASGKFVLDFPHHTLWRRMPVLSQIDQIMFVRGAHDGNDSRIAVQERGFALAPDAVPALMRDRFAIDLAAVATALSTVRPAK